MNDTPNTASSIDPEAIIKGFEDASETILLLSDTLKLFLAMQQSGVKNPYEEIIHDEVMALCGDPAPLPEHLRSFILWQTNILQLDVLEIAGTEMPENFHSKYDVKGSWLADMTSDEERKRAMQTYLDDEEQYFTIFNTTRAVLEAAEERFGAVERLFLRAKSIDESILPYIKTEKKALDEIRKQLTDIRAVLESSTLPNLEDFSGAPEILREVIMQLSEIHITLRDHIRKYLLLAEQE